MTAKPLLDGIVGARPNMIKMAPLARAIGADGSFRLRLVHTGQHFDEQMSAVFLRDLGMAEPAFNLGVGSGSQAVQTARILEGYESILMNEQRPRGVIVVGDVNSTMACALAAAKLNVPVAHVEAGLRSGDWTMPEEINRIVTDALSDLFFVSDPAGLFHLAKEGHDRRCVHYVGNIMIDTLFAELPRAEVSGILDKLGLQPKEYVYLTLHRPSNVDAPEILRRLMGVFTKLADEIPIVFAIHPRTRRRLDETGITIRSERLLVVEPLSYPESLRMIQSAKATITDSGGIQEEASVLGVPCLTVRDCTERPVTVELGSSELVGNEPARMWDAWTRLQTGRWKRSSPIPLWDGHTAERIVRHLREGWG